MYTTEKINEILQQAKNMQKKIEDIQKDISIAEITGQSGAGLVTVVMTGNYNCKYIKINSEIIDAKKKTFLQDLVASAINDAIQKITKLQQKKLSLGPGLSDSS
ncbi:YbaB/EbfC family nucleoid-associated protein [Buchnera aphidicola]|uniref:YbaB/EbfC family nucleoid-associated protein n=1 Tax=Buchnera aphidicola TaxID=9 RepID=UPI00094D2889|nr:YbaB/EbfC family nucleoid-associated protein [Buchnera aphidicola]